MPLPRFQIFEFEDLPWFPATLRDLCTDYLNFVEARFALHRPAVPLVRRALEATGARSVVDLCSGCGGLAIAVHDALAAEGVTVPFLLTDKYPNVDAIRRLALGQTSGISYRAGSVDATMVPAALPGMRTMFNAFHHFSPAAARAVLANAVEARQPIGIFEIPDRRPATIISLLFCPLFVALATPLMRPFQWRRLLWTYLIPVVPLTCCWDGVVSQFRAYRAVEMLELTQGLDDFEWTADRVAIGKAFGHLTYLLGLPKR